MNTKETPEHIRNQNNLVHTLKRSLPGFINPPWWSKRPTATEIVDYVRFLEKEERSLFLLAQKEVGVKDVYSIKTVSNQWIEYTDDSSEKEIPTMPTE